MVTFYIYYSEHFHWHGKSVMFSKFKGSLICHWYLPKLYEVRQDSVFTERSFSNTYPFKDCVNSGVIHWTSVGFRLILPMPLTIYQNLLSGAQIIFWDYFLSHHNNFTVFLLHFIDIIFNLSNCNNFQGLYCILSKVHL